MFDPQLLLGLGSGAIGAFIKIKTDADKDKHEMMMAALGFQSESANDANKRGTSWGRRFALIMVLTVGFGGLFYAATMGIKVSQVIEVKPIVDFLGLIKIGGGQKIIEADGFVIPLYVENSIISIIFFLFGSSAAKR